MNDLEVLVHPGSSERMRFVCAPRRWLKERIKKKASVMARQMRPGLQGASMMNGLQVRKSGKESRKSVGCATLCDGGAKGIRGES